MTGVHGPTWSSASSIMGPSHVHGLQLRARPSIGTPLDFSRLGRLSAGLLHRLNKAAARPSASCCAFCSQALLTSDALISKPVAGPQLLSQPC